MPRLYALFYVRRFGLSFTEVGWVDLLAEGLKAVVPNTARRVAVDLCAIAVLGHHISTAKRIGGLVKEMVIPYERIDEVRVRDLKAGVLGPKMPFIEVSYRDEKGSRRRLVMAPFIRTGMFERVFKTREFYEELSKIVAEVGEGQYGRTPF